MKEIVVLEEGSDKILEGLYVDGDSSDSDSDSDSDSGSEGATDDNDNDNDELLKAMGPGAIKTTRVDEKGREYTSYDIDDIDKLNVMDDMDMDMD